MEGGAELERLAELLAESSRAMVLTGAGVSTASGIPDFRGEAGIWAETDPGFVAHIDSFRRDPRPVWQFYARRIAVVRDARPNAAHRAIAALERTERISRVVTQNVDGLHRAAGSDPIEVHGALDMAECLECGARVAASEAGERLLRDREGLPHCDCGAVLKPGVVLFGEMLPEPAIEAAFALAEDADLIIAVGTTLEVHPVASLPFAALNNGATFAIVNRGPTAIDNLADIHVEGAAEELLPALADLVLA